MIALLTKLRRDRRGTAIIELALVAPVLAAMFIAVTDISVAYGKKLQLEQAAQRAIEKVAQTTGEDTLQATIKSEAVCQFNGLNANGTCKAAPLTTADVAVTFSLKCNGTTKTWTLDCNAGETEVRYITTTISYIFAPRFPLHFGTEADGTYHLSSTAGVRVV